MHLVDVSTRPDAIRSTISRPSGASWSCSSRARGEAAARRGQQDRRGRRRRAAASQLERRAARARSAVLPDLRRDRRRRARRCSKRCGSSSPARQADLHATGTHLMTAAAHRHSRRHVRSDSLRAPRCRRGRRSRAGPDRAARDPVATCRRTGRSRSRRRYHRFAMVALAVAGRPGWRASDLELRRDGAVVHVGHARSAFTRRGYAPRELFFIIGADAFADIATLEGLPGDPRLRALRRRRRGRAIRSPTLPHRLPALAARMVRPPLDSSRRRAVDFSDRCADGRRVIHCDPPASR